MSTVTNWFKTIQCAEHSVGNPRAKKSCARSCATRRAPSPIRPVGSLHSMTECIAARAPASAVGARWSACVSSPSKC